jgi:cell division protein FtsI/penicillin-binding protein 2
LAKGEMRGLIKLIFGFQLLLVQLVNGSTAETSRLASMRVSTELADSARLKSQFTLSEFPQTYTVQDNRASFRDGMGRTVYLTLNPKLQSDIDAMFRNYKPSYGALVALDPHTGAILAAAGSTRGGTDSSMLGRATFPAASLIKVVTAAAAVERGKLNGGSIVNFRGGLHTLGMSNYFPATKLDRNQMSLGNALGKSCNPVFARIAFNNLQPSILKNYAEKFGFNQSLDADFPIQQSKFWIGPTEFDYARAAAGFDGARISPVHAASLAAAFGNGGDVLRPYLINEVINSEGQIIFKNNRNVVSRAVTEDTANEVKDMMLETCRTGTAKRHFTRTPISVAGKTGTLKGDEPKGLYHWFIGVAPAHNPRIAVASLVIDTGGRTLNASGLASRFLDNYFRGEAGLPLREISEPISVSPVKTARKYNKAKYQGASKSSSRKKTLQSKKAVKAAPAKFSKGKKKKSTNA